MLYSGTATSSDCRLLRRGRLRSARAMGKDKNPPSCALGAMAAGPEAAASASWDSRQRFRILDDVPTRRPPGARWLVGRSPVRLSRPRRCTHARRNATQGTKRRRARRDERNQSIGGHQKDREWDDMPSTEKQRQHMNRRHQVASLFASGPGGRGRSGGGSSGGRSTVTGRSSSLSLHDAM